MQERRKGQYTTVMSNNYLKIYCANSIVAIFEIDVNNNQPHARKIGNAVENNRVPRAL